MSTRYVFSTEPVRTPSRRQNSISPTSTSRTRRHRTERIQPRQGTAKTWHPCNSIFAASNRYNHDKTGDAALEVFVAAGSDYYVRMVVDRIAQIAALS